MASLANLACYVPERKVSLVSMRRELRLSDAELRVLTETHGLRRIAVESRLRAHEMMEAAADRLLSEDPGRAGEIDWILHTHTFNPFVPFLFEPLAQFQRKWSIRAKTRCVAQLNCASFDLLFFVANELIRQRRARCVLLLAADKMFLPHSRYLKDSTVSGDGAAAALLTDEEGENRLLASAVQADATIYNSVQSPAQEFSWFQKSFYMGLVKIIRQALRRAGLTAEQIRWVFPANVNRGTWQRIAEACGIPAARFHFPTLPQIGHAHNTDALLNMEDALAKRTVQRGDYFATLTVGMGSTFGCSIFRR